MNENDSLISSCGCGESHETMPMIDTGWDNQLIPGVCLKHNRHFPCRKCGSDDE